MRDGGDEEPILTDVNGDRYTVRPNGSRDYGWTGKKAPKNPPDGSGWTTYETKYGHCGLCGNISCRGTCFK